MVRRICIPTLIVVISFMGPTAPAASAWTPSNTAVHRPATPGCGVVSMPDANGAPIFRSIDAVSENDIWTTGSATIDRIKGVAEHWTGARWNTVHTPYPSSMADVSGTSASDVWAVGNRIRENKPSRPTFEHWDGAAWTMAASPIVDEGAFLSSVVAISPTDAWAVGGTGYATHSTLTEHWDGSTWSIVPSPNGEGSEGDIYSLSDVTATASNDVWAVGGYEGTDLLEHMLSMHWDGLTWTVLQEPFHDEYSLSISAIASSSPTDVWVVGNELLQHTDIWNPVAYHWTGTSWVGALIPRIDDYSSHYVDAVATRGPTDAWAIAGVGSQAVAYHWDGTAWSVAPGFPTPSLFLNDVSVTPAGTFWAVGSDPGTGDPLTDILCT